MKQRILVPIGGYISQKVSNRQWRTFSVQHDLNHASIGLNHHIRRLRYFAGACR